MLKGYCGRVLRVDLGRRAVSTEPLKEELIKMLLGGRGIAAKYYWDEIPAGVDELGKEQDLLLHRPAHRHASGVHNEVPACHQVS